jgi:hypothetical protein
MSAQHLIATGTGKEYGRRQIYSRRSIERSRYILSSVP